MRWYPWTNTLLLLLVLGQVITGLLGLVSGSSVRAIYLHIHRIDAFAILALLPWRGRIVVQSLSRRTRMNLRGQLWILISLLLVIVLALGVKWSFLGPFYHLGFSDVSWHVYLAVGAIPFVLFHALKQTSAFPFCFWLERRWAIRLLGLAALGFFLWRGTESRAKAFAFFGSTRRLTSSYLKD